MTTTEAIATAIMARPNTLVFVPAGVPLFLGMTFLSDAK
jgi:hypothetical protein